MRGIMIRVSDLQAREISRCAVWPQPPPDNWCPSVPVRAVRSEARQRCIAAAARGGAAGYGPLLLGLVAAD
jgi:hypothetical protein